MNISNGPPIPEVPEIAQNPGYVEHESRGEHNIESTMHSVENQITLLESPELDVPLPDEPPPPYAEHESPLDISGNTTDDTVSPEDLVIENNQTTIRDDTTENVDVSILDETEGETIDLVYEFPVQVLYKLDEMINRPRWVIPVLPGGELEVLLDASISLAKTGQDEESAECLRFYREGLHQSTLKILNDEAVQNWKVDIQRAIRNNCEKLIHLIILKFNCDNFALLDILALVFNQGSRFHQFNAQRPAEFEPDIEQIIEDDNERLVGGSSARRRDADVDMSSASVMTKYAISVDNRSPKGWLVDLINRFGQLNGFQLLVNRIEKRETLSVALLAALLKPFSNCQEVLTYSCVTTFFLPILSIAKDYLLSLSDADLKKESKTSSETKNDHISTILTAMKRIQRQLMIASNRNSSNSASEQNASLVFDEASVDVTGVRLEMILRLLRVSSFNGKMNALIEINKMLQSATPSGSNGFDSANSSFYNSNSLLSIDSIPSKKLANWLSENDVLTIVLRDNLHQPQYVDKLEKIIRFAIKEKTLTMKDLDSTWNAQVGKHEAIAKNVHELLTKLAWDFSAEQLDHLFTKFKESWHSANSRKQREKLLSLIRKLAEDDKKGEMAEKVLSLLWTLAKSEENSAAEIVDLALCAHIKILDCSVSQNRDQQKVMWIEAFIDQLKSPTNDDWVILSLRMIRLICRQFPESNSLSNSSQNNFSQSRVSNLNFRDKLINRIQEKHGLVTVVANSLTEYMQRKKYFIEIGQITEMNPNVRAKGNRYSHLEQVEERLNFLCFVLKDGQLWLCLAQAVDIWCCLCENSIFDEDRQCCFRWFSKLIGEDEPDLDPEICQQFFTEKVLKLEATLLCHEGVECFEHFFKFVNYRANKLRRTSRNKHGFVLMDTNLIGFYYLWQIIVSCNDDLASKAVQILIETYTSLSPQLKSQAVKIYHEFISQCMNWFKQFFMSAKNVSDDNSEENKNQLENFKIRMIRVLTALREFISKTDSLHQAERKCVALNRANSGKYLVLIVRIMNSNKQMDDFSVATHANATVGNLRKLILQKFHFTPLNAICEIGFSNTIIEPTLDSTTLGSYNLNQRSLVLAKVMSCSPSLALCGSGAASTSTALALSSDEDDDPVDSSGGLASSSRSTGSQNQNSGNIENAESLLPSTIFSQQNEHVQLLLMVADWVARTSQEAGTPESSSVSVGSRDIDDVGGTVGQTNINDDDDVCIDRKRSTQLFRSIRNLISILPCDSHVVDRIREVCADHACSSDSEDQSHHHQSLMPSVTSLFLSCKSPNQVLYYLEVLHCLLLPSSEPFVAAAVQFRRDFVAADGVEIILSMLTGDHFTTMFPPLQRTIRTVIVKISKLLYCLVGFAVLRKSEDLSNQNRVLSSGPASSGDSTENRQKEFEAQIEIQIDNLESALRSVPACLEETILRQVSAEMVKPMLMKYSTVSQLKRLIPTENELLALYEMTVSENLSFDTILDSDSENEENFNLISHSEKQTVMLSSEALQALTLCFVLNSSLLEKMVLSSDQWNKLIELTLLKCENRELRLNCYRQILMLSTHVNVQSSCHVINFFISLLFEQIPKACQENAERSDSFFDLICKLLEYARCLQIQVPKLSRYLSQEIEFLKEIKRSHCETCTAFLEDNALENIHTANAGSSNHRKPTNGFYLCGRLNLCRELVSFDDLKTTADDQSLSKSQELSQLIKDLFCHFLFPATIQLVDVQQTPDASPQHKACENHLITQAEPICDQPMTQNAAFQLLVALAGINFNNYRLLVALLQKYFYTKNVTTISEWEFQPPIGCKPLGGFVGLKNAGATCYMNSVIQQLFMVPEIRKGILNIPGVADDYFESDQAATVACGMGTELSRISLNKCSSPTALSSAEHGTETDSGIDSATTSELTSLSSSLSAQLNISKSNSTNVDPRVQYHLDVLKYLQVIFGYLTSSQLQFYTPEGFWKHFRFAGEPVNLREQQDALEFLNSIVDSVDEATKHMNKTKSSTSGNYVSQSSVFSSTIGGSFADQKICKDCPHRYSREEPFTTLSVDIRNNQTLKDSLEQYVKGDLLEGDNAYFCEKCGKKVDTVKRMCIKKAPPVLIIQLKRFDYDWERDCAIKFNDYFEFPFQLDIEPYTVDGLAKIEGEIIRDDSFETPPELPSPLTSTIPSASSTGERTSTSRVTSATTSLMSEQLTSEEIEIIANLADAESGTDVTKSSSEFVYKLMGVVVHSGQASGGHYNSYIQCRQRDPLSNNQVASGAGKWFKFDDGDVSELQVGDDDESVNELLKSQWFGGDNTSHPSGGTSATGVGAGGSGGGDGGNTSFSFEQSSNFNRRGSSIGRRQKRWWNAYLLVYERRSLNEEFTEPCTSISTKSENKLNSTSVATNNFSDALMGNDSSVENPKPSTSDELIRSCDAEKQDDKLMPKTIAKAVQRQTILFAHNRVQFMPEYLNFIKNLISHCQQNYLIDLREIRNSSGVKVSIAEDFGIISIQLLCNVMFNTALHTKKPLRGPAIEWSDLVIGLLKHVASTRHWLAENWILKHKNLIGHYVLESPSAEVRQAFVKLLVCLCHFSNFDNTFVSYGGYDDGSRQIRISDCVIYEMAQLMRKDHHVRTAIDSSTASIASLSSPGKQLNHYFHFYLHYASFGPKERMQLLKGGGEIPLAMINLMLDEACSSSTSSHVKYQTSEFAKLYQVVSNLVRGCDLSYYCAVSSGKEVSRELYMQSNPYRDKEMTVGVPVSVALKERLIDETVYVKRIMEECPNSEDTVALVCFLSWENAGFSAAVLTDILWQITFAYSAELKPYLDLLLEVLKIPDSWQHHRIIKSLKGGAQKNKQDSKDGLFETIDKSKTHFARRAYLSIKMLTNLFTWSPSAAEVLRRDGDIRHQWTLVVDWLRSELNRNQFGGPGANTSSNLQFNQHNIQYAWSENNNTTGHVNLSTSSNETANGYALERSPSAHFTLQKASELIPRSGTPPASHLSPGVRRVNPPPNTSNSPVEEYEEDDDDDDEDDEDQYEVEDYEDDVINSNTSTATTPADQLIGHGDQSHPEVLTAGQHATTSEPDTAEVHSGGSVVVITDGSLTSPITMAPHSVHSQESDSASTVTSPPNYIEANNNNNTSKQDVNSVNNNDPNVESNNIRND